MRPRTEPTTIQPVAFSERAEHPVHAPPAHRSLFFNRHQPNYTAAIQKEVPRAGIEPAQRFPSAGF